MCLQDAADVEFAVHSLAPNEAANGMAVSHGPAVPVPAADNTSAAQLPGAEVTSGRFLTCKMRTQLWAAQCWLSLSSGRACTASSMLVYQPADRQGASHA